MKEELVGGRVLCRKREGEGADLGLVGESVWNEEHVIVMQLEMPLLISPGLLHSHVTHSLVLVKQDLGQTQGLPLARLRPTKKQPLTNIPLQSVRSSHGGGGERDYDGRPCTPEP